MRRPQGFTLIETVIVVALISLLAGIAVVGLRAAQRNANVGQASFDLVLKLQGWRTRALVEQEPHVAVVLAGDGTGCTLLNEAGCVRVFTLVGPDATWNLSDFDPADAVSVTEVLDRIVLPRGIVLDTDADGMAGRPPFSTIVAGDPDLSGDCGGKRCLAFRFEPSGAVRGESPDGTVVEKPGHILTLASDQGEETHAAERRAVLVTFPTGIVKSYAYSN
jgi:prepilin-type N-terminal cleavage/methylation domain-containing protein